MFRKIIITLPFKSEFKLLNDFLLAATILMSFFGAIDLVYRNGMFFLLACLCGLLWVILRGKIYIDAAFILTIVFSISYCVCDGINNGFASYYIGLALFLFPSLYQIGRALAEYEHGFNVVWLLTISTSTGFFLLAYLNVFEAISYEGLNFGSGMRLFWLEGGVAPRTGLSIYIIPIIGLIFPILFLKSKYRKDWVVIASLLVLVFCIWASAKTGNRSIFVVLALAIAFWAVVIFFKIKKVAFRIIYCVVIAGLVALFVVSVLGYGPLGKWLSSLYIFERFISGGSNSSRIRLYVQFFQNFIYYPFGGLNKVLSSYYVHNMILDFYTYGGIVPFICAIAFFLNSLDRFVWMIQKGYLKDTKCICIVSVICMIYGMGLFEPVFQFGQYMLFIPYLFFAYIEGTYDKEMLRREERSEMWPFEQLI